MAIEKNSFPAAWFELAANINNELWNLGLSQLKMLNVSHQQAGVTLMNGMQKHQQANKEQVAILESLLVQFRNNQQKTMDIFQTTFLETVEKLKKLSADLQPDAKAKA